MATDAQLLANLHEALVSAQQVPPSFVAAGKAAFAWRNVDAELAALADESTTSFAGVRAERAGLRALTFAARDTTIEVEVTGEALLGQVVPTQSGEVELQTREGPPRTTPVDDLGWFAFRPAPTTMFRLRLGLADGTAILTEWITP